MDYSSLSGLSSSRAVKPVAVGIVGIHLHTYRQLWEMSGTKLKHT